MAQQERLLSETVVELSGTVAEVAEMGGYHSPLVVKTLAESAQTVNVKGLDNSI